MTFVSRRGAGAIAALALLAVAPFSGPRVQGARAQTVTVRVEENLRAEPNDVILGVLERGAELRYLGRRGGWVEVEADGWVWIRSLQVSDRDGFELVVTPEENGVERENLRARPAGPVLARLERGALLMEEERIPGWVRVRRRGWVWSASVEVDESAPAPPAAALPGGAPRSGAPVELVRAGGRGTVILGAPDGDTLARAMPGADLAVVDRQGSWARVRLDGWVWLPDTTAVAEPPAGSVGPEAGTPLAVVADPSAWRGRIVTWELQFISLERAEAVRTDFFEGEPFLLTRAVGGGDAPYVYVALPPSRLEEGEGLTPLERITVVGRVRVGASALTGSPILDLVDLRRGGGM